MASVSIDFITSLSELQSYIAIFMIIDQFSKLAFMVLIVATATALETAKLFLNAWWRYYELPRIIVSD